MKKVLKWTLGLGFGVFVLLGIIFQLTTTPEERAALRAAREQRQGAEPRQPAERQRPAESALYKLAQAVSTAAAADTLEFGKPTVKSQAGMVTVLVEVTNKTDHQVSCVVTATFKKGDTILSAPTGAVNEVPAGGTRTAQLMSADSVAGYDSIKLEASTCF